MGTKLTRKFRLGTTSFIYPGHIIPNVKKIGEFFDEIELLVFESQYKGQSVLPPPLDIRELKTLARDLDLTYNVHLPVDVSLTHASIRERQKACDTINQVLDLFEPLAPTTHTLHLDRDRNLTDSQGLQRWEDQARSGLDLLIPGLTDPGIISLETLWYDPAFLVPLVRDYGFAICVDAGHHFKYNYDLKTSFDLFKEKISLIHLHGVDFTKSGPKDHLGLGCLPQPLFDQTMELMTNYQGTVSLEVFNLANLENSLGRLGQIFKGIPSMPNRKIEDTV